MKIANIFILILSIASSAFAYEYMLALERCPGVPPSAYTIHGLWPQYNSTSWPQYCNTSEHFNMSELDPIIGDLRQYWMTCPKFNHTEEWFLKHEWLKHGTCTPFSEIEYFSTGLALYDIIQWKEKCHPNESQCLLQIVGLS